MKIDARFNVKLDVGASNIRECKSCDLIDIPNIVNAMIKDLTIGDLIDETVITITQEK